MGVVDGFKGAGQFSKIALMLLTIAALFAWISYTTTGWGVDKDTTETHYGLWRRCGENVLATAPCVPLDGFGSDWWAASQALVSFGFFGINLALFLTVLYMFVPSCTKNGEIGMATAIVCIATGILYLIGIIVFAAKFKEKFLDSTGSKYEFAYSFGLSIVAMILEIVAGVAMFLDAKAGSTSPSA